MCECGVSERYQCRRRQNIHRPWEHGVPNSVARWESNSGLLSVGGSDMWARRPAVVDGAENHDLTQYATSASFHQAGVNSLWGTVIKLFPPLAPKCALFVMRTWSIQIFSAYIFTWVLFLTFTRKIFFFYEEQNNSLSSLSTVNTEAGFWRKYNSLHKYRGKDCDTDTILCSLVLPNRVKINFWYYHPFKKSWPTLLSSISHPLHNISKVPSIINRNWQRILS